MKLIICSFSSSQILAPQIVAPLRLLLLSLAHFIPLPPPLSSSCYVFPHLTKASLYYLINLQANFFLRHALHILPSSVTKKSSSAKWPAAPDVLGLIQNHLFMCPARGIGLIFAAVQKILEDSLKNRPLIAVCRPCHKIRGNSGQKLYMDYL